MMSITFHNEYANIYAAEGINDTLNSGKYVIIIISCLEMMAIYTFFFKQVGRKVAYYRRLRNMTQEELAKRINISTSSLGKIERGKYNNNISLSMLLTIADGLNIDVTMLLTFDEREKAMEFEEEDNFCPKVMNGRRSVACFFPNDDNKTVNGVNGKKQE